MKRSTWFFAAGLVVTVIGFSKTIEPLIEVGIAIVVIGFISLPKSES